MQKSCTPFCRSLKASKTKTTLKLFKIFFDKALSLYLHHNFTNPYCVLTIFFKYVHKSVKYNNFDYGVLLEYNNKTLLYVI